MNEPKSEIQQNIHDYQQNRERIATVIKALVQTMIDDFLQLGGIPENAHSLISDAVVLQSKELNLGKEVWIKRILRSLLEIQLGSVELSSQESNDYFMTLVSEEKEKMKHAQSMGNYVFSEDSATTITKKHQEAFPNESSTVVYNKAKLFMKAAFGSPLEQMRQK